MSVLVNKDTKVIIQGITGGYGSKHARGCIEYGTQIVGGCQ
jgi:succinyl-CoA synthetase alpha subunit